MAICIVERWKKSMGYRFVPECNHAPESHICQYFHLIFLPYLLDRSLLRSRNFVTMAVWRNDFPHYFKLKTWEFFLSLQTCFMLNLLTSSSISSIFPQISPNQQFCCLRVPLLSCRSINNDGQQWSMQVNRLTLTCVLLENDPLNLPGPSCSKPISA